MSVSLRLEPDEWALLVLTVQTSVAALRASEGAGAHCAEVVARLTSVREKLESVLCEGAKPAG